MAGVLDTARYRMFLSEALNISVDDIRRWCLAATATPGPLDLYTTGVGHSRHPAAGAAKRDAIVDRARNGGAEIVAHLKTGSAYYAPSAAAVQMVEAIVHDRKRILPCSAWLQGEFGLTDVYCGVPCLLGRTGLERIVPIILTDDERDALHKSAEAVRAIQAIV